MVDLPAYVAQYARTFTATRAIPGVSVGMMRDGKIVVQQGYGKSRLNPSQAASADTVYDIGSVTKTVTATAVMLLAQEHRLSIDDPVAKYVPNVSGGTSVKIRNLMNHTAGYEDYYPMDFVTPEMRRHTTVDAIVAKYATRPLQFAPGSKFSYSNTNYALLQKVIERASGMPYTTFVSKRIFQPLGMTHTHCDSPRHYTPPHAYGYSSYALSAPFIPAPEGAGWPNAAGCLASTVGDILRFDQGLMDNRILSAATFAKMSAPAKLSDGATIPDGFGMLTGSFHGHRYFTHDGGVAGFASINIVFPDDKAALVLLFNSDNVDYSPMLSAMARKLLGLPPPSATAAPSQPTASDPDTKEVTRTIRSVIAAFQDGKVDRAMFTPDFNAYLKPELASQASRNLAALGAPLRIDASVSQNHGTEFTKASVTFRSRTLDITMRRTPQKKISEFLIEPA